MSIFSSTTSDELRSLMNRLLADITEDEGAQVVHVETGEDDDVNLVIYGEAHEKSVEKLLSKMFVAEKLIGYLKEDQMQMAA